MLTDSTGRLQVNVCVCVYGLTFMQELTLLLPLSGLLE